MTIVAIFVSGLVALTILQQIAGIVLVRRVLKQKRPHSGGLNSHGISVLVPIKGPQPHLLENLLSIVHQDWRGHLELVLAFQDANDPDRAIVQQLRLPSARVTVREIAGLQALGVNPKNSNLQHASSVAKYEWLYCTDADTRLDPAHLRLAYATAVEARAKGEDVFLTAISVHERPCELGAWLEVIGTNVELANYFALTHLTEKSGALNGGSMFFHRELLAKVGGFLPFLDKVTDDLALRKAFVDAGARPGLLPVLARVRLENQSLRGFFARQLRWQLIVRCFDPITFFALAPLNWLGQWLLLLSIFNPAFLAPAIITLASRVARSLAYEIQLGAPKRDWAGSFLLPIYDLVSPFIWVAAAVTKTVSWAGQSFEVARDGSLYPKTKRLLLDRRTT